MSVLQWIDEDEEDVFPDSLRIGLGRFAAGGGFNLSVTPVDTVVPSVFFTFIGPECEELPSKTIRGLFRSWLLLELKIQHNKHNMFYLIVLAILLNKCLDFSVVHQDQSFNCMCGGPAEPCNLPKIANFAPSAAYLCSVTYLNTVFLCYLYFATSNYEIIMKCIKAPLSRTAYWWIFLFKRVPLPSNYSHQKHWLKYRPVVMIQSVTCWPVWSTQI